MASQKLLPESVHNRERDRNALMTRHSDGGLQLSQDELLDVGIFLFDIVTHRPNRFVNAGVARRFQLTFP